MLEVLARKISFLAPSDKRYLKWRLSQGFIDGEIDMNTMTFLYDANLDLVHVEGLIAGDEIDGIEVLRPDFIAMVDEVLADVAIEEEE